MLNGCSVQQIARVPAAIAIDASPQHRKTFVYAGKAQPFTVPSYLIKITVIVIGARGTGAPVTYGGRVRATIPVTGGKKLVVFVGGQGSGAIGGFNGGGNSCTSSARDCGYGGGGASDIRQGGDKLSDRIVIAGGGGGQGGNGDGRYHRGGTGGKGGHKIGGLGVNGGGYGSSHGGGSGGSGGTQQRGGSGGSGGTGVYGTGSSGANGSLGKGGRGGEGCAKSGTCVSGAGAVAAAVATMAVAAAVQAAQTAAKSARAAVQAAAHRTLSHQRTLRTVGVDGKRNTVTAQLSLSGNRSGSRYVVNRVALYAIRTPKTRVERLVDPPSGRGAAC